MLREGLICSGCESVRLFDAATPTTQAHEAECSSGSSTAETAELTPIAVATNMTGNTGEMSATSSHMTSVTGQMPAEGYHQYSLDGQLPAAASQLQGASVSDHVTHISPVHSASSHQLTINLQGMVGDESRHHGLHLSKTLCCVMH